MRKIKLNDGKEYPIYFDFNVVAEIQEKYGDITKLTDKMKSLKELRWIVCRAINEGISKENYDSGTSRAPVSEFEIGMKIPLAKDGIAEVSSGIIEVFYDSMGGQKNADAALLAAGTTKQSLTAEAQTKAK